MQEREVRRARRVTEDPRRVHLGTGTPTSAAFLTISPKMTSTSIGRLASRSTSIDGLKSVGVVRRMTSTASSSNRVPVWIPLVRATRITSLVIPLTVAFTSLTSGSARSSLKLAREIVHKLEYAAFLSFPWRQRAIESQLYYWNPPQDFPPALSNNIRFWLRLRASLQQEINKELQRFLLRLSVGKSVNSQDNAFLQFGQTERMPY